MGSEEGKRDQSNREGGLGGEKVIGTLKLKKWRERETKEGA